MGNNQHPGETRLKELRQTPDERGLTNEVTDPPTDEAKEKEYIYVPYGVTSFAQLDQYRTAKEKMDEYQSAVWTLQDLIYNIMYSSEVTDKTAAISALMDEFTDRVQEIDNTKEADESVTTKDLIDAVGKLSTLSFVDQVKEKRRLRQEFRRIGEEIPKEIQGVDNTFTLWKEADGTYRFAAIYSNNYEDRDKETLYEMSHKAFVGLANDGLVSMQELWHWHIPGTKWGQVDHLLYEDGFAVAFGSIDPGHEKEAELLAEKESVGVSHGMPKSTLLYDPADPNGIIFYTSREISPLPLEKAANPFTGFDIFSDEEGDMQFTDEKKEWLKSLGYDETRISQIEQTLAVKKEQALNSGLKSKEEDGGKEDTQQPPASEEATKTEPEPVVDSNKEVVDAVASVIRPLADLVLDLQKEIQTLQGRIDVVEGDKAKQVAAETPALSLADLMKQAVFTSPAAKVDGRTQLANDGPVENKEETQEGGQFPTFGIPVIDKAIRASYVAQ